jgi:hypothetical protein
VIEELKKVSVLSEHQYAMPDGHPLLLEKLAKMYSKIFSRSLDPK